MTMNGVALGIVLVVVVALFTGLLRALLHRGEEGEKRQRRVATGPGPQRHVGAALGLVVVVLFVIGVVLTERTGDVAASEADPISIEVSGQRWLWRYEYPEADATSDGYSTDTPYSYYDLVIPVDTPITLNVGSTDTIHRWWVPALTRSVDAVPGDTQSVTFVANEEGDYEGRSTEFSGPGYATMRTEVHVVSKDEYDKFLAERTIDIKAGRAAVQKLVDAGTAPGVALEQRGGGGK